MKSCSRTWLSISNFSSLRAEKLKKKSFLKFWWNISSTSLRSSTKERWRRRWMTSWEAETVKHVSKQRSKNFNSNCFRRSSVCTTISESTIRNSRARASAAPSRSKSIYTSSSTFTSKKKTSISIRVSLPWDSINKWNSLFWIRSIYKIFKRFQNILSSSKTS